MAAAVSGRGITVIRSVIERVDADLAGRVGAEHVTHTRATLAALIEGSYGAEEHDRGQPRDGG
jgi:hypothetical protein